MCEKPRNQLNTAGRMGRAMLSLGMMSKLFATNSAFAISPIDRNLGRANSRKLIRMHASCRLTNLTQHKNARWKSRTTKRLRSVPAVRQHLVHKVQVPRELLGHVSVMLEHEVQEQSAPGAS